VDCGVRHNDGRGPSGHTPGQERTQDLTKREKPKNEQTNLFCCNHKDDMPIQQIWESMGQMWTSAAHPCREGRADVDHAIGGQASAAHPTRKPARE